MLMPSREVGPASASRGSVVEELLPRAGGRQTLTLGPECREQREVSCSVSRIRMRDIRLSGDLRN